MMLRVRGRPLATALAALVLGAATGIAAAGEAEQIAALREIAERIPKRGWADARRALGAFDAQNPDLGPEARDERRRLGEIVAQARAEHFRAFVGERLEPILRERILVHVRPPGAAAAKALRWVRTSAEAECLAVLRRQVRAVDPSATDAEIAAWWSERPARRGAWRSIPAPAGRLDGDAAAWRAEPVAGRVTHVLGRFLLRSRLFEVRADPSAPPCERCEGEGTLTFTLSNGGEVTVLCPACGGRGPAARLLYR